jgi:electron transfer flavoprotein beta subunit
LKKTCAPSIRWRAPRLLAAAIKAESPDLVLTGLQSDDLGYGQTGVILAELLGLPHATLIMQVERNRAAGIRVKRELEDGWFQHVEMPLPALLTIQSGISKLRYATLMGIKKPRPRRSSASARPDLGAAAGAPGLRSTASICPSAASTRSCSTARPRKRPRSWWRS